MDENLQKKHKSQMSDFERIRDFQRKLYLRAKQDKTFRFYKRKSQRKSKLYRQNAFVVLTEKYGLVDPTKYCLSDVL